MKKNKKRVFVAGHSGMVGSAIVCQLSAREDIELILRTRSELDLTSQTSVQTFFAAEKIDEIYLAAAKVGGIYANNTYPAEFIYDNLTIQCNIIHAAHTANINKLLFLGSGCIYPKFAAQPISENALLTGSLEPTNEPYGIAKIAGIKLCESYNRQYSRDYRSVMPANLYGENDNFHPDNSHVLPALLSRFHQAKVLNLPEVIVWGTGEAKREFLHVDDMAVASVYIMELAPDVYRAYTQPMLSHINVGSGEEVTIRALAELMAKVVGFSGRLRFDTSKPDGTPRKLLDVNCLTQLGWHYQISLEEGLRMTYEWFLSHQNRIRK